MSSSGKTRASPATQLRGTAQNESEGVHRARELHLPAASVDADHDGSVRVLLRTYSALEHDLDLRLPHPRGGLDGGAGARIHARQWDRVLPGGGRRRPVARRVRGTAVVLLQRAQPLLPGGGEVPCRSAPVGALSCASASARRTPRLWRSFPCADRRLDADRAAAGQQRRPGCRAGALGGLRRRAVDPYERLRRSARAAERSAPRDRSAHAAAARPRSGRHRHRRSARRLVLHRGADRRARGELHWS